MDELMSYGYPKSPLIASVIDQIVELTLPVSIYLYNQKMSPAGKVTSFKLCVISDFPDKEMAEKAIYLQVDCEVPFDVILYTTQEWKLLCDKSDSFARKIFLTGTVVYD